MIAHLLDIEIVGDNIVSDAHLADLDVLASASDAWKAESQRRLSQLPSGRHARLASFKHAPRSPAVPAGRGPKPARSGAATAVTASRVEIRDRRL